MFDSEINNSYLDKIYDDFSKEQMRLMSDIKQGCKESVQNDITKQITILNTLMMSVLRYRNLKKKLALEINC